MTELVLLHSTDPDLVPEYYREQARLLRSKKTRLRLEPAEPQRRRARKQDFGGFHKDVENPAR